MYMEELCIWMCYVYGCVMYMDMYMYMDVFETESREAGGGGGTGRDGMHSQREPTQRAGVGKIINCKHWSVFPGGLEKPNPARTIDTLADGS